MLVQIEITTRCNYACFYCAGRAMKQQHMPWERFVAIVNSFPSQTKLVSLQGEGEPMMHPRFWEMVETLEAHGLTPYTITNGSIMDVSRVSKSFPDLGISIDTLDPAIAQNVGRFKLKQVLSNLDQLLATMNPDRIIVHTVDFGQPLAELKSFLDTRRLYRHVIQPLQPKSDYARHYGKGDDKNWGECTYTCKYLERPLMRYYNIDGIELPCCFIKETREFTTIDRLREQMRQQTVPRCCDGCRMIFPKATMSLGTNVVG